MRLLVAMVSLLAIATIAGSAAVVISKDYPPSLAVEVTGVPGYVYYNRTYDLSIEYANKGGAVDGPVEIVAELPETFALAEHIADPTRHGERLVWTLDGLGAGETGSIPLTVQGTLPDDLTNAVYDLPGYEGHTAFVEGFELAVSLTAGSSTASTLAVADTGGDINSITVTKVCDPVLQGSIYTFTLYDEFDQAVGGPYNVDCDFDEDGLLDFAFFGPLDPGTYQVVESSTPFPEDLPSKRVAYSAACDPDGFVVVVGPGDALDCTVTNTGLFGEGGYVYLTVVKEVVGAPDPQDFTFTTNIAGPCSDLGILDDDDDPLRLNEAECLNLPGLADPVNDGYTIYEGVSAPQVLDGWVLDVTCVTETTIDDEPDVVWEEALNGQEVVGVTVHPRVVTDPEGQAGGSIIVTCTFTNALLQDLTIEKTPSVSVVQFDGSFTYEIVVTNTSDAAIDDVEVHDTLSGPGSITLIDVPGYDLNCEQSLPYLFPCTIDTLAVDESVTIVVTVTASGFCGSVDNDAWVEVDEAVIDRDNDENEVTVFDASFSECGEGGEITVFKDCLGPDDDAEFGISLTNQTGIPAAPEASVPCDAFFTWVVPNTWDYEIHETTVPSPWEQVPGEECVDIHPGDVADPGLDCTIANDVEGGSLTIYKDVLGGEHEQDFEFSTSIVGCTLGTLDDDGNNGNDHSNTSIPCDVQWEQNHDPPYTVTEQLPPGWELLEVSCNDISTTGDFDQATNTFTLTIVPGQGDLNRDIVCWFYNDPPDLIIDKQCEPEAVETFSFQVLDQQQVVRSGDIDCEEQVPVQLAIGTYDVFEPNTDFPDGWQYPPQYSGDCEDVVVPERFPDDGPLATSAVIEIPVCTITNERETGRVTIIKQTIPSPESTDFEFIVHLGDCHDGQLFLDTDALDNTYADRIECDLPPGVYSVEEYPEPGWDTTLTCEGDGIDPMYFVATGVGADFELESGADATCTFVNRARDNDIPDDPDDDPDGSITIIKHTSEPTSQTFSFSSAKLGGFVLGDGDAKDFFGLDGGTYVVTESLPQNWAIESIYCFRADVSVNGSSVTIYLPDGGDATCIFNNRRYSDPGDDPGPTATITPTPTKTPVPPTATPSPTSTPKPVESVDSIKPPNTGDGGLGGGSVTAVAALLLAAVAGAVAVGLRLAGGTNRR